MAKLSHFKVLTCLETTYSESMERRNCLIALNCCLDISGHLLGQIFEVNVMGQEDLWGHKVGHDDLYWPRDLFES